MKERRGDADASKCLRGAREDMAGFTLVERIRIIEMAASDSTVVGLVDRYVFGAG